jgi:hypothetical protein
MLVGARFLHEAIAAGAPAYTALQTIHGFRVTNAT